MQRRVSSSVMGPHGLLVFSFLLSLRGTLFGVLKDPHAGFLLGVPLNETLELQLAPLVGPERRNMSTTT